jgi:hypothetical protein
MTRTYFFSAKKYAKNSSLKTFDTEDVHPSTIVKNFVGDKPQKCKGFLEDQFSSKNELLAYGIKGRKATNSSSLRLAQHRPFYWDSASSTPLQSRLMSPVKILTLALGGTNVRSECSSDKAWTLGRYQVSRPSGMEDKRNLIITIASAELGTKESTGNNDGHRVEQYLLYTNLGPGHDWCAAFVSWVYSQAGLSQPRNPWSLALFPKARSYKDAEQIQRADLFSIYSSKLKRIHHVGLIKEKQGQYILTIEGNSNDRVESRRRHQRTVYSYADWVD